MCSKEATPTVPQAVAHQSKISFGRNGAVASGGRRRWNMIRWTVFGMAGLAMVVLSARMVRADVRADSNEPPLYLVGQAPTNSASPRPNTPPLMGLLDPAGRRPPPRNAG